MTEKFESTESTEPIAPQQIIDTVPGITQPVEEPKAQAPVEDQPLLTGLRQEGSYTLPSGVRVSHEVTPDGMRQTRVEGFPTTGRKWKSAAEFHVAAGVATDAEKAKVEAERAHSS